MTKKKFYIWFEEIKEKLGIRSTSFMKIFNYLDSQPDPITIVETGCLRIKDNFEGDGQSTLLFDKYIQTRDEKSKVYTVDINPEATKECKKIVSDNVEINTGDSVEYLGNLTQQFIKDKKKVTIFYLDSFDVNWKYHYQSASNNLKEMSAISKIIDENTLIVVDDAPIIAPVQIENNKYIPINKLPAPKPYIGGKGFLVHEYAMTCGAEIFFSNYQTAWKGFKIKS